MAKCSTGGDATVFDTLRERRVKPLNHSIMTFIHLCRAADRITMVNLMSGLSIIAGSVYEYDNG